METTSNNDTILTSAKLNNIKETIESFDKEQQIQVLQILKVKNININENKNGVFINLTNLDESIINELEKFIHHLKTQENILLKNENLKDNYIETFFQDNKNDKNDKVDKEIPSSITNGDI